MREHIKDLWKNQAIMALVLAVLLFIITGVFRPQAMNMGTVSSIAAIASILVFASAGQCIIIISGNGGIDLSAGAVMSTTAVISVEMMRGDASMILPTLIVCILVGVVIGTINGIGVSYVGLPALIMTMCVSNILGKVQLIISGGAPRGTAAKEMTKLLTTRYFGFIPGIFLLAICFFILTVVLIRYTRFGYRLMLIGTNDAAAYLSGIKVKQVRLIAYAVGGMLAGIGGFIAAGYYSQAQCATFDSYSMMSISAVVIGGTLLSGGKGNFTGTVFGALLLTVLSNFLTAINTSPAVRDIIMGAILIVLLAAYNRKESLRQ